MYIIITIAFQDKFTPTKNSLCIKFHYFLFLRESVVSNSYFGILCKYNGYHPNV